MIEMCIIFLLIYLYFHFDALRQNTLILSQCNLIITWYLSNAIAVMEIVETNIDIACIAPQALQRLGQSGNGQCLVKSSINVSGVPTQQTSASDTAKLTMNILRAVRITGFLTT